MGPKTASQKKGSNFGIIGAIGRVAKKERKSLGAAHSGLLKNEFSMFLRVRIGPGLGSGPYRQPGLEGPLADYAMRRYSSHRKIPEGILVQLTADFNEGKPAKIKS